MPAKYDLEDLLNYVFVKQAPHISNGAKKFIVEYIPWFSLILGTLEVWATYLLWQWAHRGMQLAYSNPWAGFYTAPTVIVDRMTPILWLSLLILALEAAAYIIAFPTTHKKEKIGWDLLLYALLLNVIYGIVIAFTDFGSLSSFFGCLIGSVAGLYLLFQVRKSYLAKSVSTKKHPN